jgi:uncharacterized protein
MEAEDITVDTMESERMGAGSSFKPRSRGLTAWQRPLEFIILFVLLPFIVAVAASGRLVIPILWAASALCLSVLLRDRTFDRRMLWRTRPCRAVLPRMLLRFAILAAVLAGMLWLWRPELLLGLPRQRPRVWLFVMVLYPALSVYPQSILYRAFLFHRYGDLLRTPGRRILISAVTFAIVHVVFWNVWAVGFTLVGGFFFAATYERTRSIVLSALEQALYGCFLFTIGWGYYFFTGTMRLASMVAGRAGG